MKGFHRQAVSSLQLKFYVFVAGFQDERDWLTALAVFLFMASLAFLVALSFYGIFCEWENQFKHICYELLAIISFAVLQSSCFNFYVHFRSIPLTLFTQMPSLNRYEKVTCENCGTQTTKLNLARQKKCCSAGTFFCTQCAILSTKSQNNLSYHFAKKHSAPKHDVTFKCKLCYQDVPGFCALRQHRSTQHGMQIGSRTRDVDVEHIVGDVEDHRLREELRSCQHFLVDSQFERARQKVFKYAVETLKETIVDEKLDHFFNNLKCASKVNLAFDFILKNIEDGGFRYFYAPGNKTLLDRSKLECSHDGLAKLKDDLNKSDVIESCSTERLSSKWSICKLTNLTVVAVYSKTCLWVASLTQTPIENWYNQLFHVWRKHKTTIQR